MMHLQLASHALHAPHHHHHYHHALLPSPHTCPSAGIGERGDLVWSRDPRAWQQTLDVDLKAVMEGVRLAARTMLTGSPEGRRRDSRNGNRGGSGGGGKAAEEAGVIMITASAGGVFPMPLRWGGGNGWGACGSWGKQPPCRRLHLLLPPDQHAAAVGQGLPPLTRSVAWMHACLPPKLPGPHTHAPPSHPPVLPWPCPPCSLSPPPPLPPALPGSPVYSAAKAGCVQLTRSLAEPLLAQGIRICALCPQASHQKQEPRASAGTVPPQRLYSHGLPPALCWHAPGWLPVLCLPACLDGLGPLGVRQGAAAQVLPARHVAGCQEASPPLPARTVPFPASLRQRHTSAPCQYHCTNPYLGGPEQSMPSSSAPIQPP